MNFEQWYEKNCNKESPGRGMYSTENGDWIYKEDCKEIWDSICAALTTTEATDAIAPTGDAAVCAQAVIDMRVMLLRARWFVRDFSREVGFVMSDAQTEVMLNLFLRYAHPASEPKAPTLTDEQRTAVKCGAAAIRKVGGFDCFAETLDELLADRGSEASNAKS